MFKNIDYLQDFVTLEQITLPTMKFHQKIRALRKSADMSQQQLADKLNVHVTHLSKMENDRLTPSIDIVKRLMKVFGVSADQLLNEEDATEISLQNTEFNEQLALINQLDEEEKNALVTIINSMLTKKRMKDLING